MILVFNNFPIQLGTGPATINPMTSRAATAAAEVTNEVKWLVEVDSP